MTEEQKPKPIPERFSKEENPDAKFFCKGYFFDNEEDFWEFCRNWVDYPLDIEQFKKDILLLFEDVLLNNKIYNYTNDQAWRIFKKFVGIASFEDPCAEADILNADEKKLKDDPPS